MDKMTLEKVKKELLSKTEIEDMINDGQLIGEAEVRGARLALNYVRHEIDNILQEGLDLS